MHSECYPGTTLAVPRSQNGDRTLYVTLAISIVAHLLFWHGFDPGNRPLATSTEERTLAVTLLASHATPPATAPASPLHPSVATVPRHETPAPRQEQPASSSNGEVSNPPQESSAATTPAASEAIYPPRHDAAYLHNPEPNYPLVARRRHLEGTVVIRARIGTEGECLHTELHRSSGHTILDQAALDAVGQWRFVPARRGSETVVAWVEVPITFHLMEMR